MKVEIITLHRITNFGSMLQTYAMQTAIERLGHEAEILDFVPEGMSFKRANWPKNNTPVWKKLFKFLPLLVVNIVAFHDVSRFLRKYIHLSPKRYKCYIDITTDLPEADAYLSGSDQVWNTQNNNPTEDLKAYYLGFAPEGKKRIAYAGSFGKNTFTEEEETIIKEHIAKYDFISVREDDGLHILRRFGFHNGVHVVDPTLLLRGEEWRKFASVKNPPKPGYVFVYNLNRNGLIKEVARVVAKDKGLRIVNFADTFDFIPGAENRWGNTAEDFVNHIAHADYVVTDSFHGTAFSLNLNRQVIVVKAPRYNSRIESILRVAGLLDTRLVRTTEEGVKLLSAPIDYQTVNPRIEEARKKSYDYLRYALGSAELSAIMDNISITGKACCGCRACEQSCPKEAITFLEDEEGFLQPFVDQERCVDCGKCLRVCPIHTVNVCQEEQRGYAAKTTSDIDLKECSSGGLFYEIAKFVLNQGGVVCGCGVDESLMPHHVIASSLEETKQLRGSKYVESDIGSIYTQVRTYLNGNVPVLFTGVPCQVAGLKNSLAKEYANLYCVDIICHGVPSRKLYAAYLNWLTRKYGQIDSIDFRSKKRHQWSLTLSIKTKYKEYIKMASLDPYYYNFLEGNTYRESCYTCPYSQRHRTGDITIGDFWGIEKTHPELFDIRGVSCAIVNNEKGQRLWIGIESRTDATEVGLSDIINYNGNLRTPTIRKPIRDYIYKTLNENGFESIPYKLPIKSRIIDSLKNFIPNRWRYKMKLMLK